MPGPTIIKGFGYVEQEATSSYVVVPLGLMGNNLKIIGLEGADLTFRFDNNVDRPVDECDGEIDDDVRELNFTNLNVSKIYIKGTGSVRVYCWKSSN